MENKKLEAALKYQEAGRSVIPVQQNKKPFVKWEKYQTERAGQDLIREWWKKWPGANVAIVTGEISGVDVVDIDSPKGLDAVEALTPNNMVTPVARSPRGGWHHYHEHTKGVGCATHFLTDTDLRGDGGYIICPPSIGENGKPYSWVPGLSIEDLDPCPLPDSLYKKISFYSSIYRGERNGELQNHNKTLQNVTDHYIKFDKGNRDQTLFHIANYLVKGGMPQEEIQLLLALMADKLCNPPFPQREIQAKIQSAIKRCQSRETSLAKDIQNWLSVTDHYISVTECDKELQIVTSEQKANRRVIFHRLVKDGILERDPKRPGVFRKIEDASAIDFLNAADTPFDIKWPFGLEDYALIHPKNIIVIAGTQNAGKTALVLNVARMNMARYRGRIRYISSEMGGSELKSRLKKFEIPLEDWTAIDFREKSTNFSDIILPDGLNIIDFYEISDKFWLIAEDLKRIYEKLNKGIAIVCLQKSPGKSEGRGGDFGLEKPRLYLNLDPDPPDGAVMTIRKAKAWAKEGRNPNHYKTRFKIVNGAKLIQQGGWQLET